MKFHVDSPAAFLRLARAGHIRPTPTQLAAARILLKLERMQARRERHLGFEALFDLSRKAR